MIWMQKFFHCAYHGNRLHHTMHMLFFCIKLEKFTYGSKHHQNQRIWTEMRYSIATRRSMISFLYICTTYKIQYSLLVHGSIWLEGNYFIKVYTDDILQVLLEQCAASKFMWVEILYIFLSLYTYMPLTLLSSFKKHTLHNFHSL